MTEYVVIEGTARTGVATNDTGGSAADATSGPVGYAHLCGPTVNGAPITAGLDRLGMYLETEPDRDSPDQES